VKTVVTSPNALLAREFASEPLCHQDVELVTVRSSDELMARVRAGADLCFVDPLLPDGTSGYKACAKLREDKDLWGFPIVLAVTAGGPRVTQAEAQEAGFNEAVELPAAAGALSLLVGRYIGVPLRDADRLAVQVHVHARVLEDDAEAMAAGPLAYLGTSVDLAEMGMLVKSGRRLARGTALELGFTLPGQERALELEATVVRVDEQRFAPAFALGLVFDEIKQADREALRKYLADLLAGWPFRWQVSLEAAMGGTREVVTLSGALPSDSYLAPLEALRGEVDIRMRHLRRLSSDALGRFADLVQRLRPVAQVRLVECPVALVRHANQIPSLLDGVEVVSFFAPYNCPRCGIEDERLVDVLEHLGDRSVRRAPDFNCIACGGPLVFDDIFERYFAFLNRTPSLR
jgi:CheY-like chemotaxis protein